jgi:hypothetical protein
VADATALLSSYYGGKLRPTAGGGELAQSQLDCKVAESLLRGFPQLQGVNLFEQCVRTLRKFYFFKTHCVAGGGEHLKPQCEWGQVSGNSDANKA